MRNEVNNKADILAQLRHLNHSYAKKIKDIDAAASEFDAPPEVFAQAYRRLRDKGYKHFTYHAGEDFYHVLSGLRAIYEAIDFLDLRRGDRIGHATAAGISCNLWRNNLGDKLLIRKGEYLDDLVFTYHLISQFPHHKLMSFLPQLNIRINTLCFEVYNEYIPLPLLVQSWLYRWHDPFEAMRSEIKEKYNLSQLVKYFLKYHNRNFVER